MKRSPSRYHSYLPMGKWRALHYCERSDNDCFTGCPVRTSHGGVEPRMHLNQARMDNEVTLVPGVPFSSTLPYVDFRVYGTELVD